MEKDFLKKQMTAESGAFLFGEGDVPSEIENQFLGSKGNIKGPFKIYFRGE